MARTRLDLCYLFSLCVQSWFYASSQHAAVSGEAGIKNKNNISAGVHLNTSSDVTIRVHKQLKLNCTIAGAINSSSVQLSWYRGGQELSNVTRKLSNKKVQLVIDHVSWINNGSYTCRENSGERVEPKSVMVRVGDIPGPPRDVWINNVELRTYIHWKAPVDPGGLQFSYAVKGQCKNASTELPECQKDSITLCEHILQEHGSVPSNQFVCTVSANLHWFVPGASVPVSYIAFIEASNVLGSRRSDAVEFTFNLFNVLLTTPQPDISPSAKEVEPPGTVKLTWKDAREQRPIEVEYTILYHKDGDKENKSVIVKAPRTNILISDLVGFSRYHFFILVRYAEQGTAIYGIYSKVTALTARTKISAPKVPPVITNCSHWSNLGLMVTWKIPQAEYFNGPSKSMTIFYRCQTGQNISGHFTVRNSTTHSAVITAVRPSDACLVWTVWMKLCNTPELCSSISNMCQAKGSFQGNSSRGHKNTRNWVPGAVLGGSAGGLLLVIITVWCYRHRNARRNHHRNARRPLRNVLDLPQVIHGYDEIEESLDNCYDVINV